MIGCSEVLTIPRKSALVNTNISKTSLLCLGAAVGIGIIGIAVPQSSGFSARF